MTKEEFKAHIIDISKNNTCHRPDISHYGSCEPCAFKEHCQCLLNTNLFNNAKTRKRKRQ